MLSLWGNIRCLIGLQFTEIDSGQKIKKDGPVRDVRLLQMGRMSMAPQGTYVTVMFILEMLVVGNTGISTIL